MKGKIHNLTDNNRTDKKSGKDLIFDLLLLITYE